MRLRVAGADRKELSRMPGAVRRSLLSALNPER